MKKKLLAVFAMVTLVFCLSAFTAHADSTIDVTIYGTYNYTNANKVLEILNEERVAEGLSPLVMDPYLTEYAMQRAAEISVYYNRDHLRPNGEKFSTVVTNSNYSTGTKSENIALGQTSPAKVMTAWMNSSGHKANILSTSHKSVGIGCFRQDNGEYCWVQLFYSKNLGYSYSESGTVNKTNIPISMSTGLVQLYISGLSGGDTLITNGTNSDISASLFYGHTTPITLKLRNAGEELILDMKTSLSGGYSFTSGNSSVVTVSDSSFVPMTKGTTTMNFSVDGYSGSFPIGVFDEVVLNIEGVYHQTEQKVELSWDNSSGAANLLLYQDAAVTGENSSLWDEQTNVNDWNPNYSNLSSPAVTISLTPGESLRFRVFTLVDSSTGRIFPVSNPVTVTGCTTPVATVSNDSSTGKPKISWGKVYGAVKYIIHRTKVNPLSTDTDRYTTFTDITKTSFIDTTAQFGKEYTYQVVAVNEYNCQSGYSSKVSGTAVLPAPTLKATNVASTGKIKLSWTAVSDAIGYEVYRSTSKSGTYTKLTTTTNTSVTNNKNTAAGKTYYYKVRAIHRTSDLNSAYATATRMCDLPQVTNVKVTNVSSTGKPRLSWNAVSGASKYYIYRATSKNGTYTHIGTTSGTTATNTKAVAGKTYYYKVRAVHTNSSANGALSSYVYRTCDLPQVTNVQATNVASTGKPKLTWNAVSGASKYYIYSSTSKNGTYTHIGTTTKTTATNTKAVAGKTYYYKVRAIHSSTAANGALSSYVARTCDLARPTVKVTLNSNGKPKLSWDAVSGAGKYYIYRSTSENGTYTHIGTTSGTTATNTKAVAGKTYYYKVKAICSATSSGDSAYSAAVSITSK